MQIEGSEGAELSLAITAGMDHRYHPHEDDKAESSAVNFQWTNTYSE
jgi:hypothetical protein